MDSIEITAPAKVNLFLKVLNKRRDSYHNILTLFERISLADKIRIEKAEKGIKLSSDKFITADPKDNLAYKAAASILKKRGMKEGVKIKIEKIIPIAAGLGGGSSDAAAVLAGIDKLFGMKLGRKGLGSIASRLGSDVAFFMLDRPFAVGRERGNRLTPIASGASFWHLIVYPGFGLATELIYKSYDKYRNRSTLPMDLTKKAHGDKIHRFLTHPRNAETIQAMMHNDLESIAIQEKPAIGGILRRLAGILDNKVMLSGSGPSVFCLYKTRKEAEEARRKVLGSIPAQERKGWQLFVASTA